MATGVCAQNGSGILTKHVKLTEAYTGSRDSLVKIVTAQTGVIVAYSSRSMPPGMVSMRSGSHTMKECLKSIFGRYDVRYVCHENEEGGKVVVTADSVRVRHVTGHCRDAQTGEVLIGAHTADTLLRRATASNEYGFFSLAIPTGRATIRTSFVGYAPDVRTIDLRRDTIIDILLKPRILLADIEVKAPTESEETEESALGQTVFTTDEIENLPSLLGESDLGRALQQTPGVSSGNEGFGGMSVRGGSQDQNNVLLDDAPLFNANHMLGFFSVFNSDAINQASLIKSGFPARYGGRISSVLDIKTLDGDMTHFRGDANLGLIASTLRLQGPIKKQKSSYLFSARRSYLDIFSNLIQQNEETKYSYLFYDFHGKVNWKLSARDRLRLSLFQGTDRLTGDSNDQDTEISYGDSETRYLSSGDENDANWGTLLASLRWSHIFGSRVFSNVTAWASRYRFSTSQREQTVGRTSNRYIGNEYRNGIVDAGLRADVSIFPDRRWLGVIRLGAWSSFRRYQPMVGIYAPTAADTTTTRRYNVSTEIDRYEIHGYMEDHQRIGRMTATAGVHFTIVSRPGRTPYLVAEPRLMAGWKVAEPLTLKVGYSLTTQFAYQMRMMSVASPSDIWLPVPSQWGPQRSSQVSVEMEWRVAPGVRLDMEAYYKNLSRIVTYKTESPYEFLRKMDWDNIAATGSGYAQGIELFLKFKQGRMTGWAGYTLSKARSKYADINNGDWLAADNDRRHTIQLYASVNVARNVDISASWTYGSGAPLTLPSQRYNIPGSTASYAVEAQRNALRMPSEHQLNIGANIRFDDGKMGSKLSFGLYNAYGHPNPMFVYWKASKTENSAPTYSLKKFSLIAFPWPYIKYSIRF